MNVVQIDVHLEVKKLGIWLKLKGVLHQVVHELLAPPTIAAVSLLVFI